MTRCPLPRVPAGSGRRLHPDQPAPGAARTHRTRGSRRGAPTRGPEGGRGRELRAASGLAALCTLANAGVRPRRMATGCARSGDGGRVTGGESRRPGGGLRRGARTTPPEPGLYPEPKPRALTPRLPRVGPVVACLRRREEGLQSSGRGGRAVGGMGAGVEEGVSGPGGSRGAGRGLRDPGGGRVGCCCTQPTAAKSAVHGPALTEP